MVENTKRTYTREFKLEAVRFYQNHQKSMSEVERELGITPYLLSRWMKQFQLEENQAFPGKGKLTERDEELRSLRRENEILKQERDILKKQWSFSRNQSDEAGIHSWAARSIPNSKDVHHDGRLNQWLLCLARSPAQ